MSRATTVSRSRCLLVGAAATLGEVVLAWWLVTGLASPDAGSPVEAWLVSGCEVAGLVAASWLWLLVLLVCAEAAGSTRRRSAGVPAAVRRVVLLACGAGLAGALATPAVATAPPPSTLDGLALPDRATSHLAPPASTSRPAGAQAGGADRRTPSADRAVDVVPGDSLWAIAAAELPEDATAADVDRRWRAIHAANREVIGEDPDLILPGQRLRLPGPPYDT